MKANSAVTLLASCNVAFAATLMLAGLPSSGG